MSYMFLKSLNVRIIASSTLEVRASHLTISLQSFHVVVLQV
jgi:hypothetical protein